MFHLRSAGKSRKRDAILRAVYPVVAAAILALSLGPVGPAQAQSTKLKLLLPVRVVNESFSPFVVPKYLGYYAQEGLDVELIPVGGSNEAAIAVASRAGDVGAVSPGQAIVGMQSPQGLDVKYFFEANYRSVWTVTVHPDSPIQKVADLKGKRIGVSALGSAGVNFGKALITEAGLDPDKDAAFIAVGLGAQTMTGLNQKLVDALVFSSAETNKFEANGFKLRYIDLGEGFASLPDVGLLARQEMLANNPKVLVGIARAVAKGYLFSLANPAAAVKISWKVYPEVEPKNIAADEALRGGVMVNRARMEIWSSPKTGGVLGKFIDEDWKRLVDYLKQQGVIKQDIPLSRIYTNDLLPQINDFDREAIRKQAEAFNIETMR
jgi:NitT/TauT family transport system substrate-binding protein